MLTTEQVAGTVGDANASTETLNNVALVAVSPDEQAVLALTIVALPSGEVPSLAAVAQQVLAVDAQTVAGFTEASSEVFRLDGRGAVRITFVSDVVPGQTEGARLVRQVLVLNGDEALLLSFIVAAEAAESFEETYRTIEASWTFEE